MSFDLENYNLNCSATMSLTQQIAGQFREVYLNGTWVSTNLKTQLADVDWQMAAARVGSLNTIAALTFHLNYYMAGVLQVMRGGPLDISDKYSFDMPPIENQNDWEALMSQTWGNAENLAAFVEQMPEAQLHAVFVDPKYGNYHRNIHGMIEHGYYHLGQIVLIKKMLRG